MKLTQQACECTRIKKEADAESGTYVVQTKQRTMNCKEVQVLVRSEHMREHCHQNKTNQETVTDPVKPLQIRFLRPSVPRPVLISLRILRLLFYSDCPSHSCINLEHMPTGVDDPEHKIYSYATTH